MTNWAGAVETLGKGLFAVGMKVTQREDDEIAFMRQKALQELGIQAQKDLQKNQQDFLGKQADKQHERALEITGIEAAARAGEQQRGFAHTEQMAGQAATLQKQLAQAQQTFQIELRKYERIDDIQALGSAQIKSIDGQIFTIDQKLAELPSDENSMDPAQADVRKSLQAMRDQLSQSRIATERDTLQRIDAIQSGGPRGGVKPEDVQRRLAELGGGGAAPTAPTAPSAPAATAPPKADGSGRAGEYTGSPKPAGASKPGLFDVPYNQAETASDVSNWAKTKFGAAGNQTSLFAAEAAAPAPLGTPEPKYAGPAAASVYQREAVSGPEAEALRSRITALRSRGKTPDEIRRVLGNQYAPVILDRFLGAPVSGR